MATQNPPIPARYEAPRFLDYRQSQILRELVDDVVLRARETLLRDGCDPRAIEHEIAFALARAACRFDLNLLDGAAANIIRLEAAVAELGARLEQAKIAQAVEGEARPREDWPAPEEVARVSAENGTHANGVRRYNAGIRGVDFDCEQCGGRHGSRRDDRGFYRCSGCGYPGQ